jgi:hypothetical protein
LTYDYILFGPDFNNQLLTIGITIYPDVGAVRVIGKTDKKGRGVQDIVFPFPVVGIKCDVTFFIIRIANGKTGKLIYAKLLFAGDDIVYIKVFVV